MTTSANKQAAFFASMFTIAMAAIACAPSAYSAPPAETLSRTVSYSDLNLDSASGANTLYARLRNAAHTVCAPFEGKGWANQSAWHACISTSIDAAVAQINNRTLTAIHSGTSVKGSAG
jgi:UrcA family protein